MEHYGDREGCRGSKMMSVCELFADKEVETCPHS